VTASVAFVRICDASCIASCASSTVTTADSGSLTVRWQCLGCGARVVLVFSSEPIALVSASPNPPEPVPAPAAADRFAGADPFGAAQAFRAREAWCPVSLDPRAPSPC